jgi:hypothetical protein
VPDCPVHRGAAAVSSIPHAPFELVIIYRDHKIRVVRFETLRTALASAATLRDSLISSWRRLAQLLFRLDGARLVCCIDLGGHCGCRAMTSDGAESLVHTRSLVDFINTIHSRVSALQGRVLGLSAATMSVRSPKKGWFGWPLECRAQRPDRAPAPWASGEVGSKARPFPLRPNPAPAGRLI